MPEISASITKITNKSLECAEFPLRWKMARVTSLFKSGDRSDLNNYRPISVLPILSKILERHVYIYLYDYLSDNNLIYQCQSGFRKNHGTETALIKLIDELLFCLDINQVTLRYGSDRLPKGFRHG